MGSNGKGQTSTATVRYADYVEDKHRDFLNVMAAKRAAVIDDSPFTGEDPIPFDDAFLGVGFVLSDFPSLYDMYGKFMAGLDIEVLYDQIFADTVGGPQVGALVSAEAALLEDDMLTNVLPRFQAGMRNINSVISSTFVVGKAMIEDARVKSLSKFSAELKYRLIPVATERWTRHLEWNRNVVMAYAEIIKMYFLGKHDTKEYNLELLVKDRLWPFTVLEYQRAAIGALQGATTTTTKAAGSSQVARALSSALSGGVMGAMVGGMIAPAVTAGSSAALAGATVGAGGGPMGIIIGGLLGLAGSFF